MNVIRLHSCQVDIVSHKTYTLIINKLCMRNNIGPEICSANQLIYSANQLIYSANQLIYSNLPGICQMLMRNNIGSS
jgi:hypothetical protein